MKKEFTAKGYSVTRAYIVPLNESVLRKKYNGSTPLEDEDRKALILSQLESSNDWIKPYFGLLESGEIYASREIMKEYNQGSTSTTTFITIMSMHKLNIAVRIAVGTQQYHHKVALIMNKSTHFQEYDNTEA